MGQSEKVNGKCDVWSSGVVLFEMLTGKCLFEEMSQEQLLEEFKDLNFSEKIKKQIEEGLEGCSDKLLLIV